MSASAIGRFKATAAIRTIPTESLVEPALVGLAAVLASWATFAIASSATAVYITPDGAHAITDSWALIGRAPHPFYYLPGWPLALLPFLLTGMGTVASIGAGMSILVGLLLIMLYLFMRPSVGPRAAFVGAAVGTGSAVVAEALGWQGGPTLFALVMTVASLAAFEQWEGRGQVRYGVATGACYAVVLATHPFMAAVATGLLGLRWLAAAWRHRPSLRGTGPTALTGLLAAGIVPIATAIALAPRYLMIDAPTGSGLRAADVASSWRIFTWVTRESPVVAILYVVIAAAALASPLRSRSIAIGVVGLFAVMPAVLSGDTSYQSRVAYVLPIALAIGAGRLWLALDHRLETRPTSRVAGRLGMAAAPVIAALVVVSVAFPTRLSAAVAYYGQLAPADAALLASLSGQPGQIVTSWSGNRYWDGMGKSWYAEGFTDRAAFGPADPAMLTRVSEREQAAAAWQLFSGQQGLENGGLQVAFGPSSWRADPAIAANIAGYYIPLVYVNETVNGDARTDGQAPTLDWTLDPSGSASAARRGPVGSMVTAQVALSGDMVHLRWTRGTAGQGGDWTLWLWPAYGLPWLDVTVDAAGIAFAPQGSVAVRESGAWLAAGPRVRVTGSGATVLRYLPSDPAYGLQAIAISAPAGRDVTADIAITGTLPPGAVTTYDERSLLRTHDVGTVAVWTKTGWLDRFSTSPCFRAGPATESIATFTVEPACRP